jgi:hypothetical protein
MGYRVEFDPVNKILLGRLDGRLTDESLAEFYEAARKYSTATDPNVGIVDLSPVTEVEVSAEFLRGLAQQVPAMPHATRPRIIVAPKTHLYGLFRMFQIVGESERPLLTVVRTLDEAFAAVGVQSPHFEPLD